jgi:hypothetical protein
LIELVGVGRGLLLPFVAQGAFGGGFGRLLAAADVEHLPAGPVDGGALALVAIDDLGPAVVIAVITVVAAYTWSSCQAARRRRQTRS